MLDALDAHAIVGVTDRRGLITYVNRQFCDISGYAPTELLGQDHRILNSGRHPRVYMRDMWRTIFRGEVWHGEFCNRAKDGSLYWVQSTILPVAGDDGRPEAFISLRTDVSALRQVEAKLASSELRFRRLFEQSSDALLLLDVERGCFIDANNAAARMLGFERGDEIAGRSPDQLSPPRQECGERSEVKARGMIETAIRDGSHRFEWLHCSERRAPFPVEVLLTPMEIDGERLQFVTWRDISAQRQQRDWTEASSRALSGIARHSVLADVLSPLFEFAAAQAPGLGFGLIRRSGLALGASLVLSRNLDAGLLAGVDLAGGAVPPCTLLGDSVCVENCPATEVCAPYKALRAAGCVEVVPLEVSGLQRSSLVLLHPDAPCSAPERLGMVSWQLWIDLVRLALDEEASREQMALSQAVFESTAEGIAVCDRAGRVLRTNPALIRMIGSRTTAEDLLGQNLDTLVGMDGRLSAEFERALSRDGFWLGERRIHRPNASPRTWLCSASLVGGDLGGIRVIILTDITEQRAQRERIEHLAFYDPLTQLPNRTLLQEQLEQAVLRAQREAGGVALLFIDLDRFKEVNDGCGHAVGDQVLTCVAQRLSSALPRDILLARMGGDEFMVLADHARADEVVALVEQLLHALRLPLRVEDRSFSLDASVGISLFPADARTADELMKHADIAMYQAKRGGSSLCFYHSELGSSLNRRLLLAERLKRAMHEQRLRLHYQPQVDLVSGALAGAEVLLRWQEPDIGWVAPSEFIAVAESSGLMLALGDWVLEAACSQLRRWHDRGLATSIRLSINLSPLQLAAPDFEARLQDIMSAAGILPGSLELELTESTLVADPEAAMRLFDGLVAQGMTLAIDDFGTGYSSLSYLKRFPAKRLKIDRGFVSEMLTDGSDSVIVETIIAMARSLRLQTVAEGVERPEEARRLSELGCTVAQGYLYAPALAPEAFENDWLKQAAGR